MHLPNVFFAIFLVLHGLVHLLYVAHSLRMFELAPGLQWPDGSWAFSRMLGVAATRLVAAIAFVLAAAVFAVSGAALLLGLPWWQPACVVAVVVSSAVVLLMWNGRFERLPDQGAIALAINAAILVAVLGFRWPSVTR